MFPESFLWGTATSATQTEGAARNSDWLRWEEQGRAPQSGSGNGFATHFAEDFALYADHGLRNHRLGIDWARIEPEMGRRDDAAIDRYREILTAAHEAGIDPWLCLHHFTLPGWFSDEHGFIDDKARGYYWPRHVAFCAETFGDLVAGWQPINEPFAYSAASYLLGEYPPGLLDPAKFLDAYRGMLLAQRDAWRELRGGAQPVATVHNLSPLFPIDDSLPAEKNTATVDELMWNAWIRADRDGVLAIPGRGAVEIPDLRECADFIGFSYYNATAVDRDMTFKPFPNNATVGPLGYAPWAEGLALTIRRLADELPDRPLLVCELGLGTPRDNDDDDRRESYLRESLGFVEDALGDGIDVRGVFFWTGVDNYEWTHGYNVNFGLFDRNRQPRRSAESVAEIIRARRVT